MQRGLSTRRAPVVSLDFYLWLSVFLAAHLHHHLIDRPPFSQDFSSLMCQMSTIFVFFPVTGSIFSCGVSCGVADPWPDRSCLWSCCDGYLICSGFHSFSPVCARACVCEVCQHWNAFEVQTIVIWQHYDVRKWMWAVFPRPRPFGCWTFSFHSMWSLFVYVRHTSGHKYGINVLPNANRHTLTQYQSYTLTWIRNKLNWNVSQ